MRGIGSRLILVIVLLGVVTGPGESGQLAWIQPFLSARRAAAAPMQRQYAQEAPWDPRFGVVEAFWDTQAAVEGGAAWERILFMWSQLQPYGPDDWNTLHVPEEWLQSAAAQGRQVVGLLKNTPSWAAEGDPNLEASPPRGLDLPIDDPGNLWATFVRRVVSYYGARGVHRWIIWNEPDIQPGVYGEEWHGTLEGYYRLLKVAYLVIKEVDPGAQAHLAGITYHHDRSWLRRFLAVATADPEGPAHGFFFDVVSLHIYFKTDSVDYVVNQTWAALNAYGVSKPIWINETNASPDSDPLWPLVRPRFRVDLREQASFILQAYALGLAAGVQRIAVYRLVDAGLPPGGEPFGLLRPDHSRRPAFTAYRLVTRHYAGTRSGRTVRDPAWAQVTLDRGERTTRVFWARTQAEVSLSVPALAAQGTLIDQEGNVATVDGTSGYYALTLPGARCVDEVDGCFIGGPTYLLVEEARAGAAGTPQPDEPTPMVGTPATVSATAAAAATLAPTPTLTATLTMTPTDTPSPTASPTPRPSATATPSRTPTVTPSVTPSATPAPSFSPTPEPTPTRPAGETAMLVVAGLASLVGLIAAAALVLSGREKGVAQ